MYLWDFSNTLKNAANLLTPHINHNYIQMFSPVYHLRPDPNTNTEY